uniref:cyclin-dependent kinase n=1 Tax=Dimocarpus longan TaxID=128017 RepID=A0A8G0QXZ1_9ROSI|nr:G-type cyclin-dependent kinase 2 [Dimocarpus longan]
MAAGRVDVPRRREYSAYGYFKKEGEVVHYKNGIRDAKLSRVGRGCQNTNGCQFLSDGQKFGSRRSEAGFDDAPCVENGGVSKSEDEVQLPPEKKRKFSPIIWDLEEKEVRISSKNRIIPTSSFTYSKFADGSAREVSAVDSDGGAAKDSVLENQVEGLENKSEKPVVGCGFVGTTFPISPVGLSASLPHETAVDGLDQAHLEEELVQSHSILASRWAYDSDTQRDASPSGDDDDTSERGQSLKSSTPESGEFCRESSEDSARSNVVCSSKDEYIGSESEDDVMDIDKSPDEVAVPERRSKSMLNCCRCLSEFERLNKISEGTYGIVHRARDKMTGEIVALKEVKMNVGSSAEHSEYGFPLSSLREINILLSFNHPSIVNVKEVVMHDNNLNKVFMVMEYMEHDLKGLMESMKQPFSTSEVKCLMLQLLEGVKYLHDNWVFHRDLKTSNLLLNNQGELKICDFGMSRQYGNPLKSYTTLVVTLWYRAPELLLGMKKYSTAVDMWSVGCIMAELLAKKPLFDGKREVEQIDKIFKTLGTPTETIWPGFSELPGAKANFVKQPYNLLRKRFPATSFTGSPVLSESGYDLLNKLLTYDPDKRITADDALNHDWFHEVPLPKSKEFMPTFPPQHARNR